mmetsp:Transcript_2804/g.8543  ORF Transcript_2804/g.8543 Transcript_2804/m.8543 type:complete len:394 (+) Transcript_2804:204-1385(+)
MTSAHKRSPVPVVPVMVGLRGTPVVRGNMMNGGLQRKNSRGGHESVQATVQAVVSDQLAASLQELIPPIVPKMSDAKADTETRKAEDFSRTKVETLGVKRDLEVDGKLKAKRLRAHWKELWITSNFGASEEELDERVRREASVDGYKLIAETTNCLKNGDEVRTFHCEGAITCGCPFRARWKRLKRRQEVTVGSLHQHAHNARRLRVPMDPSVKQYITELRKNGLSVSIITDSVNRAISDGRLNAARPSSLTVKNYCYSLSRELGSTSNRSKGKGKEGLTENLGPTNVPPPADTVSRRSSSAFAASEANVTVNIANFGERRGQANGRDDNRVTVDSTKEIVEQSANGATDDKPIMTGEITDERPTMETDKLEPTSTMMSRFLRRVGRLFGYGL